MGLSMMPTMTAAMQAVPAAAIARTSTAMNIIRQSGASIGTAILSVLLAAAISDKLLLGNHPSGGGGSGFQGLVIFFGPNTRNTDLPSIAKAELTRLRGQLLAAVPGTTDKLTKYHLEDLAQRIRLALNPKG